MSTEVRPGARRSPIKPRLRTRRAGVVPILSVSLLTLFVGCTAEAEPRVESSPQGGGYTTSRQAIDGAVSMPSEAPAQSSRLDRETSRQTSASLDRRDTYTSNTNPPDLERKSLGPLQALFQEDEDASHARELHRRDLVRECMSSRGFDYFVTEPEVGELAQLYRDPYDLESRRNRGYGILEGIIDNMSPARSDPNQKYYEALSPGARASYDDALYGTDSSGYDSESCFISTAERSEGGESMRTLAPLIVALEDRISSDVRLLGAWVLWSDCMTANGFRGVDDVSAVYDLVISRIPSGAHLDDLTDAKEFEISVALTDLECWAAHVRDIELIVRNEMEAEFVDNHELEILAAITSRENAASDGA